jgi:outer membrane protein OmpA-like peptidoglycan-associated protein
MLAAFMIALAAGPLPPPPMNHDPFVIFFRARSSALDQTGKDILKNVVSADRSNAERCMQVIGHADSDEGSIAGRRTLSERRASAAKRFLVSIGVPPHAVRTQRIGDALPMSRSPSPNNRFVSADFCYED